MGRVKDETGKRYGKLIVIKQVGLNNDKKMTWLCKCDCGKETVVAGKSLRSGSTKSCGCYKSETAKKNSEKNKTHGETNSRLYNIWRGVKKRCRLKSNHAYKCYGAKDIDVCEEWYSSYEKFREWSLNNGYEDGLTLDRINGLKGYTPNNCRWTDWKTQENNRCNNVIVTYKGKQYPRGILASKLQVTVQAIYYRQKHNIPLEREFKRC